MDLYWFQRNFTAKLKNLRSSWVLDFPSQPLKLSTNVQATEECYEQKKVQEVTSESIDYEEKLRTVLEKEGVIEDLVDD